MWLMKTLYEKKVVKFGGSSLASAEQFVKSANIIKAESVRRFVVPSAPGKRFDGDTKVTDLLINCYNQSVSSENWEATFDLNDFLSQMEQMKNMGPMENILKMLPGVNAKALSGVNEIGRAHV